MWENQPLHAKPRVNDGNLVAGMTALLDAIGCTTPSERKEAAAAFDMERYATSRAPSTHHGTAAIIMLWRPIVGSRKE